MIINEYIKDDCDSFTEDLYGKKQNGEKDILLYFDIAGKDIINVLTKMIIEFDKKDLAYDIEIPSFRDMENGHTDAIRIATSVENLKSIVNIFFLFIYRFYHIFIYKAIFNKVY